MCAQLLYNKDLHMASASRVLLFCLLSPLLALPLCGYVFVLAAAIAHKLHGPRQPAGPPPADAQRSPGCGQPSHERTGQAVYRTLDVGGVEREYLLWLPEGYDPERPYPLLLSLHGATNSPVLMAMQDQLHCLADTAPFIVAWPAGYYRDNPYRYSSWNVPGATARGDSAEDGAPCIRNPLTGEWGSVDHPEFVSYDSCEYGGGGASDPTRCFSAACVDDFGFGAALVEALEQEFCVDVGRLSLHGHSMGGMMALTLASAPPLNARVRAVVAHAAAPFAGYNSPPSPHAVPLLKHDAREDWVVPPYAAASMTPGQLGPLNGTVGEGGWLYTRSVEVTAAWASAFDSAAEQGGGAADLRPAGSGVASALDGYRGFGCEMREGRAEVLTCEGSWTHSFALATPLNAPAGIELASIAYDFVSRFVRAANGSLAAAAGEEDASPSPPPLGASRLSLDACASFGPYRAAAMLAPGLLAELARRYPPAGAALIVGIVIGGVECVLLCLLLGASAIAAVRALAKSHSRSHLPVRLFGHASLT